MVVGRRISRRPWELLPRTYLSLKWYLMRELTRLAKRVTVAYVIRLNTKYPNLTNRHVV